MFATEVDLRWECRGYDTFTFEVPVRAFLLRLQPGASIHPHIDADDVETYHFVLQTNERARNCWRDESGEHSMHMQQGKVYRVNRKLEHWAVNDGDTDRVHLLVEFPKP